MKDFIILNGTFSRDLYLTRFPALIQSGSLIGYWAITKGIFLIKMRISVSFSVPISEDNRVER